jgi:phosphatidylinositol alpha 1,6-mannosyltransferase
VPSLVTQGSPVPDADADRWVRTVGSRADRVVVTCRAMSARLAELGIDAAVWAPGVDVDEFTPVLRDQRLHDKWARARSRGGPLLVVGYVGDLRKREGTRRLADVARVPGVRLVVVGEGPQREWLDENIPGAKVLTGPGAHDRAVALASFDVLVHPGLEQTSCHVLREAAASGVPVVAPAACGTPDAVRHGRTGLLHDPEDPRALRRAVATLAGDGVLRASLGAQGRARSLHRTWADAVDELLAVHHPATPGGATLPAA